MRKDLSLFFLINKKEMKKEEGSYVKVWMDNNSPQDDERIPCLL